MVLKELKSLTKKMPLRLWATLVLLAVIGTAYCQTQPDSLTTAEATEVIMTEMTDSALTIEEHQALDSLFNVRMSAAPIKKQKDWTKWAPDPKRAMWLGIVLPGAGQIYNRKYWKLPIIYGGIVGCIYAWRWNNMMYTDYSRAYIDLLDDDPQTQSYNSFMHLGAQITDDNKSRFENIFQRRKDMYRRWRDLSVICLIGVYALSIIDAYVDASLSQFDVSRDLSLRVEPTVLHNQSSSNPFQGNSLGVQCQLNF